MELALAKLSPAQYLQILILLPNICKEFGAAPVDFSFLAYTLFP